MILGNKCDMDDKRQVAKARGETIAREHSIPFLETSAKANINVEKAFIDLAQAILNKVWINVQITRLVCRSVHMVYVTKR
jgi:Ras-related protein Rab-10